jgi:hypothetical protein
MFSPDIEYTISNLNPRTPFLGCFPLDQLPPFPTQFPSSLIINTHKSSNSGEHWLALVVTRKKCFYFDSFGLPILEEAITEYLNPHYDVVTYSDICIQDDESDKCGQFCISFVTKVKSKSTYNKFMSHFNPMHIRKNDVIIENLLRE